MEGIQPPVLADRGLVGAVESLALDLAIPVTVTADVAGELEAPLESAVYFAIAEALANIVKHSRATAASVDLSHHGCSADRPRQRQWRRRRPADIGQRARRNSQPPRGLRRDAGRVQPEWRPDRVDHGGAVRVVIAEDLALLRDGLTRLLQAHDFEVVAAVGDAGSLAAVLEQEKFDIAILDVRMPPTFTDEGLVAAIEARSRRPGLPVLVLSQYVEQLYARELLASGDGAIGYLLKDRVGDVPAFVDTVRRVAAGATVARSKGGGRDGVPAAVMTWRR